MANIAQEILELRDSIESAPRRPFEFMYPASLVKQAAEMFKDQDWYINGSDGSRYYHGELVKAPSESVDVTRLNERIAAMELPDCLQRLSPKDYGAYVLGQWGPEEKEETP